MTQLNQIYRCAICGNVIEVLHSGAGQLVCCGQPMDLLTPKINDEGFEKHLPIIKRDGDNITINVSSIAHPMEENHYIEFIELITDKKVYKKFLKPGDEPAASFKINTDGSIKARAYCNIHGVWEGL